MATWEQFADAEPQFAAAVWARFAVTKHHVLATLRRDGSPRVSGTEVSIVGPNLTLGSMLNAMKAAAIAVAEGDPGPFHLFHLDLTEVVLTSLAPSGDYLLIQSWRPGGPIREARR